MNMQRLFAALAASLLAASAMAQTGNGKPLNLKLPPSDLPAAAGSTAPAASSTAARPASRAPGVYYGDTSGSMGDNEDTARVPAQPACDDSTYNQPQIHGSVGMGVVGGRHVSGNYQGGTVNISQAFGSCDEPRGGVSISIGGSNGHFHGHH
jgi:hypothetical protein